MATPTNRTISPGDGVQLPMSFDAARMQEDIRALNLRAFMEYDVLPLRISAHLVDRSLAPPRPAEDNADGSWTDRCRAHRSNAGTSCAEVRQSPDDPGSDKRCG